MKASIFNYSIIKPFSYVGLTSPIWDIHFDTLIQTWIMMALIVTVVSFALYAMRSPRAIMTRQAILLTIGFFVDLIEETCGVFREDIFYFSITIFIF
ncbi:hypothetical protein JKY79_00365, partial [Candidatus Babeliales bacterium]|nr:hypothetical protein [Candidatus Babeliales bacterium]